MTLPVLPSIPRLPKSADLPSADLVPTTDQIDPHVADKTDDLGPAPDGLDTDVLHYPRIADLSKSLARAVAEFEPGMAGRIKDFVATTARAGLLMLLILVMACGQGPVPVGPDPVPAQPVIVPAAPAPVPATTPPKTQPAPVPSRLRLPTTWVEVEGVRVPVGPILDTDLNRPCQLQALADGSALCVPTDTVRVEPTTETAFIDIDCTVGAVKLSGRIEAWDGARVWRYLAGTPQIPAGTAANAQRDPVTGQCKPARIIMAGGDWAFASVTPLLYALIKRLD
mgnify:FL=1